MRCGFLGLGRMGEPMAANLLTAGHDVVIWNRSAPAVERLAARGAASAATPREVLGVADVTIEMLSGEEVIDAVLRPADPDFGTVLRGGGLLHMSTTSPECSSRLAQLVRRAGGWYVEAPVSGSRLPAEQGRLVAMAAGDDDDLDRVRPLLDAMCATVLRCGQPPRGDAHEAGGQCSPQSGPSPRSWKPGTTRPS